MILAKPGRAHPGSRRGAISTREKSVRLGRIVAGLFRLLWTGQALSQVKRDEGQRGLKSGNAAR
jgi:hypothetical protein